MDEKIKIRVIFWPILLSLIALIQLILQEFFLFDFSYFALKPRTLEGLIGIVTSVFIHASWSHLSANLIPFLIFSSALFYYYHFAGRLLVFLVLITNFYVWLMARDGMHVGASGIIYGLASFHILSAILRKELRLMAFSLLVIFLYGGMIWGFFPEFFPNENISWESHAIGFLVGIVFAVYYKNQGPQKPTEWYENEIEDVIEIENEIQKVEFQSENAIK